MAQANPRWGAPRIHGELLKLGIDVCQATVAKYMGHRRQPPSQTWRTFLRNHVGQIVAADFFVVPTATYRLLFVLVLLAHDRRRIRHSAVTAHPTSAWTAQQLREAFPWDEAPRYLLHDRDHAFDRLGATAKAMGIEEVLTAVHAPWQPVRGTGDRLTAARVPGPRHRVERTLVASPPRAVPHLLPRVANASLPRQGCSRPAAGPATDVRRGRSSPASRRSAPSLRTSRRLKIPLAPRTELPFGLAGRGASPPGAGRPQSWRAEGVREFSGPHVGVSNRAPSKASSVPMEFLAGTGIERVVPGIIPHHSQTMLARC